MYAGGVSKTFTELKELKAFFLLPTKSMPKLLCKSISIRIILFNEFIYEEGH